MDTERYGFDFVALKETKCQDCAEIDLMNYSLILFEQLPTSRLLSSQFGVSNQLRNSVVDWRRISITELPSSISDRLQRTLLWILLIDSRRVLSSAPRYVDLFQTH